jgi:HTH-type transcriptional repressor of NAD biosynthesis genes
MSTPRRVAIFGVESTGKTSLAQRLASHFDEPWAPEFVREFWDLHAGQIGAGDLGTIALGQIANEDLAAAQARQVVFCDTELITCTLWNDLLFPGKCPAWVRGEAEQRARAFALYLLCDADVAFTPDPQRCFPGAVERERARQQWKDALVSRGLPFVEIQGAWSEREQAALRAVHGALGR